MSDNYVIKHGQSLVDAAIQRLGSLDYLFDIAAANGMGITDGVRTADVISIAAPTNTTEMAAYIQKRKITIAASYSEEGSPFTGIGYWAIEDDFIVS